MSKADTGSTVVITLFTSLANAKLCRRKTPVCELNTSSFCNILKSLTACTHDSLQVKVRRMSCMGETLLYKARLLEWGRAPSGTKHKESASSSGLPSSQQVKQVNADSKLTILSTGSRSTTVAKLFPGSSKRSHLMECHSL